MPLRLMMKEEMKREIEKERDENKINGNGMKKNIVNELSDKH